MSSNDMDTATATATVVSDAPSSSSSSSSSSSWKQLTEGSATVLYPASQQKSGFYNPAQVANRDLSMAFVRWWLQQQQQQAQQPRTSTPNAADAGAPTTPPVTAATAQPRRVHLLEALAATGLRSIRYYNECGGRDAFERIVVNDLDAQSVDAIRRNVQHNKDVDASVVQAHQSNAIDFMYSQPNTFDIIDLDPYGSPSPFIDSAMRSIRDGGLLCVTATDMQVLGGPQPGVCFAKYGGVPFTSSKLVHEQALRILLATLHRSAAVVRKSIEPLGSFFIDFYCRLFVRVHSSPKQSQANGCNIGIAYRCMSCQSTYTQNFLQPKKAKAGRTQGPPVDSACPECGSRLQIGGPNWTAGLHDEQVLSQVKAVATSMPLLSSKKKIVGLLSVAEKELPDPYFFHHATMSKLLGVETPPLAPFRAAIADQGYLVSSSHHCAGAIKTNAPAHVVWNVMRSWAQQHPSKRSHATGSPAATLLGRPCDLRCNFDKTGRVPDGVRIATGTRFVRNAGWGPKSRATLHLPDERASPSKRSRTGDGDGDGDDVGVTQQPQQPSDLMEDERETKE